MNRLRLALYALGGLLMAFGAFGLLTADRGPGLFHWARFWLGGLAAHDLVLAPATILAGVIVSRLVPRQVRPYVQAGLVLSGAVIVVALPLTLARGRSPDLPSALPLDYGRGLLVTLCAVWLGVGAAALLARRRRQSVRVTAHPGSAARAVPGPD